MSRPRWSVPSQCSSPGRASVAAASVAIGSWVASWSANTAVSTMITIKAPPAAPSGFLRQKRRIVVRTLARRGIAGASTLPATTGVVAIALARVPHARVEPAVQQVDEQIRQDDDDRDEHHERLHDRIVAPQDGLNEEPGQ